LKKKIKNKRKIIFKLYFYFREINIKFLLYKQDFFLLFKDNK
jgi:hypothetical protein